MQKLVGTYRKAPWGCYLVRDIIGRNTALCFDYEGHFEKPVAEISRDPEISRHEFVDEEERRTHVRFSESVRIWAKICATSVQRSDPFEAYHEVCQP